MSETTIDDAVAIEKAAAAAFAAGALVIQQHLGPSVRSFPDRWFDCDQQNLLETQFGSYLAAERDWRKAEESNPSLPQALTLAIAVLCGDGEHFSLAARQAAGEWLADILAQRDCANWSRLRQDDEGEITISPAGRDRLVDLIAVIVRG
jgi:hypothetical protein